MLLDRHTMYWIISAYHVFDDQHDRIHCTSTCNVLMMMRTCTVFIVI